ncbi:MAG: serine/threonine protein kinase [Myxococcales bacterium]|nr:serine/threonine protein kinase [Myxococcales bacterium]MCB9670855.1 serine/threonine protein kinase [Alphaproteobacteria bacterium]MCB9691088.1 serine/threonine protein kinase [Alphaproteobacteria bacterium]
MSEILFHERLGRGGYGEVYRASLALPDGGERVVAVKLLNSTVQKGSDAQRRLRDEARLLGAIHHPNILRVFDLTEIEGHVAMVAEYVPGEDLDRCVLDGMPARALLEVLTQVASALSEAWNAPSKDTHKPMRLVHRDIKPENLRVRPDGSVKILDFGVALATEMRREAHTATNTVMGSYRYMAPERFDSELVPHPSVDVFAMGCILYEGLAYRRLFEHLSMREMMLLSIPGNDRYAAYIAERLEELPDTTDAKTMNLIHKLVDRDPARRPTPEDVAALCQALADHIGGASLKDWARTREWAVVHPGEGDWTGRRVDVPVRPEALVVEDDDITPERIQVAPRSDYSAPFTRDELMETEVTVPPPVPLPERRGAPGPDDVTLHEAIDSLNAATSTPTGSDERIVAPPADAPTEPTNPPPVAPPSAPAPPDDEEADARTTEPTLPIDLDELRRAIGIDTRASQVPAAPRDSAPRPAGPSADDRGAIYANVLLLVLLTVIGGIALGLAALIALR